jgi:hypothetical protein
LEGEEGREGVVGWELEAGWCGLGGWECGGGGEVAWERRGGCHFGREWWWRVRARWRCGVGCGVGSSGMRGEVGTSFATVLGGTASFEL